MQKLVYVHTVMWHAFFTIIHTCRYAVLYSSIDANNIFDQHDYKRKYAHVLVPHLHAMSFRILFIPFKCDCIVFTNKMLFISVYIVANLNSLLCYSSRCKYKSISFTHSA